MGVTVSITRTGNVSRTLHNMSRKAADPSPAWRKVGTYMSRTMRQQFVSEGRRLGTPWRQLKPEYKKWKVRNGFSRKILVQTGALRKSFTGRPMDIEIITPKYAVFGSSNQKAVWHHYGTKRNGKQVNPPRKILVVTHEVRREIKSIVTKYIADGN